MEWVWSAIAAVAAVGALGLTFRSERRATRAERQSAKSAEAAERAATALEESNRIRLRENPPEKPPWGDARWVNGELFAIRNESGRKVIVEGVEADDEQLARLLRHRREYPAVVDPGDTLEVLSIGTMAGRPSPVIAWRWDGDTEVQHTRRAAVKP